MEKKEAIKLHVSGEFKTFDTCYKRLNGDIQEPDLRINLESFLLHARNLYHFLYTEKKNDDDISATDFSADYFKYEKEGVPILKINKQLSHITYARSKPTDLYKKRKKIYETIRDALVEYNKQVPEEYKVDLKTQ